MSGVNQASRIRPNGRVAEPATKQPHYRVLTCCLCLVMMFVSGCRRFPADFPSRPLPDKIAFYEQWLRNFGRPRLEARLWISWHGRPAADEMVPYVMGQKKGIPNLEAIWIIWAVQSRGCSLRGTPAEKALHDYLKGNSKVSPETRLASSALDSIEADNHFNNFDSLPPGPCNTKPSSGSP